MVFRPSLCSLPIVILSGCVLANMGQTKVDHPPSQLYSPPISMVRLLANTEKFDGSKVTVSGCLHLHFEDAALYLSKSDADYLCSSNALWVEISDSVRTFPIRTTGQKDTVRTLKYFDFKHVTLTGTFRAANHGHMGVFPGAIESVDVIIEDRQWYDGSMELWEESGHGLTPIKRDQ